ncbi:MAG TPA: hypothetical protein VN729_13000, partial [Ktedonobacteraceae bacterium]|nr:hypothetical protein [Ktedonobacteraceae bacterium]
MQALKLTVVGLVQVRSAASFLHGADLAPLSNATQTQWFFSGFTFEQPFLAAMDRLAVADGGVAYLITRLNWNGPIILIPCAFPQASVRAIEKSLPTRTGLQAGPLFFFLVRRGMGYAHTSPHQKENERAAGATFKWP